MHLQSLTDGELRERTLDFSAGLRVFQKAADEGRGVVLDRTLPGWSAEARASGFRHTTRSLQNHHDEVQSEFKAEFEAEAIALQRELMARLGIAVRRDGAELTPLRYNAADYLEDLAQQLGDPPPEVGESSLPPS